MNLQDMLALPAASCKTLLQQLFRSKSILKVGYALANDLRAISTALGPLGAGCIAEVQPCIDLHKLNVELRRSSPGSVPKVMQDQPHACKTSRDMSMSCMWLWPMKCTCLDTDV